MDLHDDPGLSIHCHEACHVRSYEDTLCCIQVTNEKNIRPAHTFSSSNSFESGLPEDGNS